MLNIIVAEFSKMFLKFLLCFSELFFLLYSFSFLFFSFPLRKLCSLVPKQLQRLSSDNKINLDWSSNTGSAIINTYLLPSPTWPEIPPKTSDWLMLSLISLFLLSKIVDWYLFACVCRVTTLAQITVVRAALPTALKIFFSCCYTHFLQAFVQSQLHLNGFIKMIFNILHLYQI